MAKLSQKVASQFTGLPRSWVWITAAFVAAFVAVEVVVVIRAVMGHG